MPSESSWNVIADADSNEVILGVDFPAAGRPEADFAELMTKIGPRWSGYRFLQTAPPDFRAGQRPSPDAYTRQWVEDIQNGQWRVVAVLGFCIGAVFAAQIADSVFRNQPQPPVVLFDPQFADTRLFLNEARKIFGQIRPLLPDDKVTYAKGRIDELIGSEPDDMADIGVGLAELYQEMGPIAFAKLRLDDVRQEEIIRLFDSYMGWLSVAARIDPTPTWKRSAAIMSTEYVQLAGHDASFGAAHAAVGRKIPVDVTHGDLLRSDPVIELILRHVEEGQS